MLQPDSETKKKWKALLIPDSEDKKLRNGMFEETHEFLKSISRRYGRTTSRERSDRTMRLGKGKGQDDLKRDEHILEAVDFAEPDDIISYLRASEDFAYLRPSPMKMTLEPEVLDFQSMNTSVTKYIVLKYRAARGDHTERSFYVSVDPLGPFQVNTFHLKLQGEGVHEIHVSFYPTTSGDKLDGTLSIVDESGNKLAVCLLQAVRQPFIKVNPTHLDCGWVLPGGRKEMTLQIESTCLTFLTVNIFTNADRIASRGTTPASRQAKKANVFTLPIKVVKLQPMETKNLIIVFEPGTLGQFSDLIEIHSPGGSITRVDIQGVAGTPIAVFPEDEECSEAGSAALTRERSEFMRKFKRAEMKQGEKGPRIPLSPKETEIFKSIMAANGGTASRREAYTLDFGICLPGSSVTRCLTIMNLSVSPVTVGLYCYNQNFYSPHMVRIASYTANSVDIHFHIKEGSTDGPIDAVLEIMCPEFQNLNVSLKAFVGYPVFFPSWDFAFFKPCRIGMAESLAFSLINLSHYRMEFITSLKGKGDELRNFVSSTLPLMDAKSVTLESFSTVPALFYFHAKTRGPYMEEIRVRIQEPFKKELPAGYQGRRIYLVGMCIEPFVGNESGMDKNDINYLRLWMSHPKRLLDEYPTEEKFAEFINSSTDEVPVMAESPLRMPKAPIVFQPARSAGVGQTTDIFVRRSQLRTMTIENTSDKPSDMSFFASTCYSVDPRSKVLDPLAKDNVDVMYIPPDAPDFLTTYGFAAALEKQLNLIESVATVGKNRLDFLVFPTPGPSGDIVIDFGMYTISTKENSEKKYLVMCNNSQVSYSWSIKFASSKTKFIPFETMGNMGEIGPNESFPLPITFYTDTSGSYESQAEIMVKETLDRNAKLMRIASVVCRGTAVLLSAVGFPDTIDFGHTVVSHQKQKSFIVQNKGTTHATITSLVRSPFQIFPKSCNIPPGGEQDFFVTYAPTESKSSSVKLLLYVGHKLQVVNLTGHGGVAELVCEKYDKKEIFFGYQKEGTISWIDIYLTNKGTMPLTLKAITTMKPDLLRLEYIQMVSTIPYDNRIGKKEEKPSVSKNYWSTVRKKLRVILIMRGLIKKTLGTRKKDRRHLYRDNVVDEAISLAVSASGIDILEKQPQEKEIPDLRPFYSYHFRIGLINKHQTRKQTEVNFHYLPVTTEEDPAEVPKLLKAMNLMLSGVVYRELEIFPTVFDFGYVAAESFLDGNRKLEDDVGGRYGMERDGGEEWNAAVLYIKVVNPGFEAQNLTLQHITTPFTVSGRQWHMPPGEKLEIGVEFHPPRGQEQHHGEVVLGHKYGSTTVQLIGTGACAEVDCDKELDFGTVKVGVERIKQIRMANRGLLRCKYEMQINQKSTEYRFCAQEPFDIEGVIESGQAESVDVKCCCQSLKPGNAHVMIRWQRVPRGVWEELTVPISVVVGQPLFKLATSEVDFGVTYVSVNKKLFVEIRNDGNAACAWAAKLDDSTVTLDCLQGVVAPFSVLRLGLLYTPVGYVTLHATVLFETEAGKRFLNCYGTVGIPYLKIAPGNEVVDFGIAEIGKSHPHVMSLRNTGTKPIEFRVQLTQIKQDGIELQSHEYGVFLVEPNHEVIPPSAEANLTFVALPRDYNAIITATYVVTTTDGERYLGELRCVGGKAIISVAPIDRLQLAPPHHKIPGQPDLPTAPLTDISSDLDAAIQIAEVVSSRPVSNDVRQLLYHAHLQTLMDALNGLKTSILDTARSMAEPDSHEDGFDSEYQQPPTVLQPQETLTDIHEQQTHEKQFLPGELQGARTPSHKPSTADVPPPLQASFANAEQLRDAFQAHEFLAAAKQFLDPEKMENELHELEKILDEFDILRTAINPTHHLASAPSSAKNAKAHIPSSASRSFDQRASSGKKHPFSRIHSPVVMSSRSLSRSLHSSSPKSLASEASGHQLEDIPAPKSITEEEFNDFVHRVYNLTEDISQHLKAQIERRGTKNRTFLSQTLRKITESSTMMEGISRDTGSAGQKKKFSLGLMRGGTGKKAAFLFNIPNSGNLPFSFEIVKVPDRSIYPHGVEVRDYVPFELPIHTGIIEPRQSTNLLVNFTGTESGLYQQEYELRSDGVPIFKFVVMANVGNPKLVLSPSVIDFGLVPKNQSLEQFLVISNVGTYKSNFYLENMGMSFKTLEAGDIEPDLHGATVFTLSDEGNAIEPNQEITFKTSFFPPFEGFYEHKYKLVWEEDPIFVFLKGVGGVARIKVSFGSREDEAYQGLLWGICVVDDALEKIFTVTNHGNCETVLNILHEHPFVRFELPPAKQGALVVAPGELIRIKAILQPTAYERLDHTFILEYNSTMTFSIPMRGLCGIMDYAIQGQLDFMNMKVDSTQVRTLSVTNTGDLDISVRILVTESLKGIAQCSRNDRTISWDSDLKIRSKEGVDLEFILQPTLLGIVSGVVTFTSRMGNKQITFTRDLQFRVYDEQLCIDNSSDADVGKVTVGESAKVIRTLVNYGTSKVLFRAKIECSEPPIDNSVVPAAMEKKKSTKGLAGQKRGQKKGGAKVKALGGATTSDKLNMDPEPRKPEDPWKLMSNIGECPFQCLFPVTQLSIVQMVKFCPEIKAN
jgi:hypothetical protein